MFTLPDSTNERAYIVAGSCLNLVGSYVNSTLAEACGGFGATVVDDFVTFAQQLREADLPVCDSDDFEDLNGGDPIGNGTTMTVFRCLWKSKKREVAVKRVNLGLPLGKSTLEAHNEEYRQLLESLFLELRVMNHPWFKAHPNIVDLLGVSWEFIGGDDVLSSHRPAMIVELADQTYPTLRALFSNSSEPVTDHLRLNLLTDVAEGMTILHATKVVHGDLKPENVLLFLGPRRLVAKLSDFGFCSPFVEARQQVGGTYFWNAPVGNFKSSIMRRKADCSSLGMHARCFVNH